MNREILAIWAAGPPFLLLATWPYREAMLSQASSPFLYHWINTSLLLILTLVSSVLYTEFLRLEPAVNQIVFGGPYLICLVTYSLIYLENIWRVYTKKAKREVISFR